MQIIIAKLVKVDVIFNQLVWLDFPMYYLSLLLCLFIMVRCVIVTKTASCATAFFFLYNLIIFATNTISLIIVTI